MMKLMAQSLDMMEKQSVLRMLFHYLIFNMEVMRMADLIEKRKVMTEILTSIDFNNSLNFNRGLNKAAEIIRDTPSVEAETVDRDTILRLCNEIEMIIVTVCNTGYTLQEGDEEAIMKRTKAIRKELAGECQ